MDKPEQIAARQLRTAARDCLSRGDLAGVEQHCRRLLERAPDDAEGWYLLGSAAMRAGQPTVARDFLARAAGLAPQRAECLAALAQSYSMTWHHPKAADLAREALALKPESPDVFNQLGQVLLQADCPGEALAVLEQAAGMAPHDAGCQFNLASACRALGRLGEARAACEAALAADPGFFRAQSMLAELQSDQVSDARLATLKAAFSALGPHDVEASLHVGFALSRALEAHGHHAKAMHALQASKAPARRMLGYEFAEDQALFDALMQPMQSPPAERAPSPEGQSSPIFVMGMPRSGTTLLERMLSSHPEVGTAGEVHNFGILLQRAAGDPGMGVPSPALLARAANIDFQRLGTDYIASVRARVGEEPYFVDKLPHNFLFAGFIARALPAAPLVCLRRHPMDTCLGNFRQLFALGFPFYRYSYALLDTAHYFVAFDRLLRHWQTVLPGRILEVEYEALVTQPERELRRVLTHCGLPWDPACLAFSDNAAPVTTASAVQVREGLNTRAFGRWRLYESELQGVRAVLEQAGIKIPTDNSPAR